MNPKLASSLLAVVFAFGPLACAASDMPEGESYEDGSEAVTAGSATPVTSYASDTASTVSVKNGVTLTMHTELTWRPDGTISELVLHGSTSQNINYAYGFIPDDGFGTATQLGPRSFEIAFDNASDINTVISGNPFYLELQTHTTAGDATYAAQFYVAPHLAVTAGTSRLTLGSALTPTYVTTNPDAVVFRGTATTTSTPQSLSVTADVNPLLTHESAHAWQFDWQFGDFVTSAASTTPVVAKGKFGATTSTRSGKIEIRFTQVSLALGQMPDDIYGFPVCDPAVEACIQALPAGTTDYGSCGAFFPVSVCLNQ